MQLNAFFEKLSDKNIEFFQNEPMDRHTTFRIGGKADVFINIRSEYQLTQVLSLAKELSVPYFIIGKGSNILVSDDGIEGAVISLSGLNDIKVEGDCIVCGAGASLMQLCKEARDNGLSGLEFAYGIPGSVGGALYMNAGAYGGEIKNAVKIALGIDKNGKTETYDVSSMNLGYRTSVFKNSDIIITGAVFKLNYGDKEKISKQMNDYLERRKQKQPLEYPSAGSTFKRPNGNYAGTLIEKNGFKGESVGGAEVSEKHAGFIVNKGGAKCCDVLSLIEKIQSRVKENNNVDLEPEVIFVGRKGK